MKDSETKVTCNQCKNCAVENTAILGCADDDCRCHTKTPSWEKRFDHEFKGNPVFRISPTYRAKIKSFISRVVSSEYKRGVEEAIELSDKIELEEPDGGMEQWKAFKRFRNTLRSLIK